MGPKPGVLQNEGGFLALKLFNRIQPLKIYNMSVPNTNTFSLTDVVAELGGEENSLQECFDNAIAFGFDPIYVGSKNSQLNFRNYEHIAETLFLSINMPSNPSFTIDKIAVKDASTFDVDFGDGNSDTYVTGSGVSHSYTTPFTGVVQILNDKVYIFKALSANSWAVAIDISSFTLLEELR